MYNWVAGEEVTSVKLNKSQMGLGASAQSVPDMTLKVSEGVVKFNVTEVRYAGGNSPTFTAPGSNNRIDLLTINQSGALEILQGVAALTPSTPAYPKNKFVIAEVYLRAPTTSIKDSDDSINGYVSRDARHFTVALDRFGGDGSDGTLSISSGTTTIDLGGAAVFIKNYSSISITGTGKLTFINPHFNGTLVVLKSQGNVTLTSTVNPLIDLRGIGASASSIPNFMVGGALCVGTDGVQGVAMSRAGRQGDLMYVNARFNRTIWAAPGAGGGHNGGGGASGGIGGGGLLIECEGALNFTGTINSSGSAAQNGVPNNDAGGGGGACGIVVIIYNTLTLNTGTITATGGAGGSGIGTGNATGGGGAGSWAGEGGPGGTGTGSGGAGGGTGAGGGGAGCGNGAPGPGGPSAGGIVIQKVAGQREF